MDDKEYYSLLNRSSSWELQQLLKKKNQNKTQEKNTQNKQFKQNESYANLELRQGSADAQMLLEKKSKK